jgi:hypothetical protein
MKILGKLLFPDSPPYEQRKKIQILLASIAVGDLGGLRADRPHTK